MNGEALEVAAEQVVAVLGRVFEMALYKCVICPLASVRAPTSTSNATVYAGGIHRVC